MHAVRASTTQIRVNKFTTPESDISAQNSDIECYVLLLYYRTVFVRCVVELVNIVVVVVASKQRRFAVYRFPLVLNNKNRIPCKSNKTFVEMHKTRKRETHERQQTTTTTAVKEKKNRQQNHTADFETDLTQRVRYLILHKHHTHISLHGLRTP